MGLVGPGLGWCYWFLCGVLMVVLEGGGFGMGCWSGDDEGGSMVKAVR